MHFTFLFLSCIYILFGYKLNLQSLCSLHSVLCSLYLCYLFLFIFLQPVCIHIKSLHIIFRLLFAIRSPPPTPTWFFYTTFRLEKIQSSTPTSSYSTSSISMLITENSALCTAARFGMLMLTAWVPTGLTKAISILPFFVESTTIFIGGLTTMG